MILTAQPLIDFPSTDQIERDATIRGEHDEYRYDLTRVWARTLPLCAFVMLNPSTADGKTDDATIRKVMRFAWIWGYGGIVVVNLFAYRARNPATVAALPYKVSIGPLNDDWIKATVDRAEGVICAWGSERFARQRAADVTEMLRRTCVLTRPECLRLTKGGAPWHPLYVPYSENRKVLS